MNDTSFTGLLNEQNLSRIDIDSRLVDSFGRVMNKLQAYFDANGYTSQRNYAEFFEEYLLKDMPEKLKIVVSNEPSTKGFAGIYRHSEKDKIYTILIDEFCLNREPEYLDSVLCHEFIHFLAMRGLDKVDYPDPEIKNGGFINEAITEMLNQQMYPNSRSYRPQVDMLKFANLLTGNVNNYSLFLRGKVDSKGGASSWNNFFAAANAYHRAWSDKGFSMEQAINDPNYLKAQEYIIYAKVNYNSISSFEEYKKWVSILQQRPAPDSEFMDKFFSNMDNALIGKLGLKNDKLQQMMLHQLLEYRQIPSELAKYDGKDVYEFEIAGHKVAIDKDRNLYGRAALGGHQTTWNPNTGIWELKVGNEIIKLDINTIDFAKRRNDLLERQQTIPKYFLSTSKDDVKAVSQVAQTEGLVKLEKFTLPSVGLNGKKNPTVIYVATYGDRIEILNNPMQLGLMDNVKAAQYIGITSQDPKVAAIYTKPLGSIDIGIMYSKYSEKYLTNGTINALAKKITPTLSQEQLQQIISQYKQSDEYSVEDDLTDKQLQEFAIMRYAKEQYYNMPEDQRKKLIDEYANSQERFIISSNNGNIEVSLLFGNQIITAFQGQSEVLVDSKGNGLYNAHCELLSKGMALSKTVESEVIKINHDGNIDYSHGKNESEEVMSENKKSYQEYLTEINTELEGLRQQYGVIGSQMEDLMRRNAQSPIPNYQEQLNRLIQQRDSLNERISTQMSSQRTYQSLIAYDEEVKHKAVISHVESLFGIRITDSAGYEVDPQKYGGVPKIIPKNSSTLRDEQGMINQQLQQLYQDGKLDVKTYQTMLIEVGKEYRKFIEKAPAPITDSNKPAQPTSQTSNQPQDTTPQKDKERTPYISPEVRERVEYRKRFGYDTMTDEEKEEFDARLDRLYAEKKSGVDKSPEERKKELEELKRELRKKQLGETAKNMGVDEYGVDLESIFREQQIIEQSRMGVEEVVERTGRRM